MPALSGPEFCSVQTCHIILIISAALKSLKFASHFSGRSGIIAMMPSLQESSSENWLVVGLKC